MNAPRRVAATALALAGFTAGCEASEVHVFGAYRYDPELDCFEDSAAVDVIEGPSLGTCERLRCWISPGGDVYVTTEACDAPPGYEDGTHDPTGTPCSLALVAFSREGHGACE